MCSMCVFRVYGSGMAHLVTLAPLLHHFGSHKSANVPGYAPLPVSIPLYRAAIRRQLAEAQRVPCIATCSCSSLPRVTCD